MARPKLGQHFLTNGSVLERIAAAACPQPEDLVIEIGPGRGSLTRKLLQRAARVVAVEVDPYLAEYLRSAFAGEPRLAVIGPSAPSERPSIYAFTLSGIDPNDAALFLDE